MESMWKVPPPAAREETVARPTADHHVTLGAVRVEVRNGNLEIVGTGVRLQPAIVTFGSFDQLAGLVGAPADYLRTLGTTLAAQNLNHRLKGSDRRAVLRVEVVGARVLLREVREDAASAEIAGRA